MKLKHKIDYKGLENYLKTIIKKQHTVFEIGCGGGQWTKLISSLSKYVICNDAKNAEDNRLFEFLKYYGIGNNVYFFQAIDFNLDKIPDNSLDIVFSYDVFCHISLSGQREYLHNLYKKCKSGCLLIIMIADPYKYTVSEPEHVDLFFGVDALTDIDSAIQKSLDDCDGESVPGRWYFVGIDNFIKICLENQYTIIQRDLNIDKTNPIVLFQKP
jgi:SAM-dependent methyltransferase